MKKNYMMRIAAVLLVLVLLSTCVISGTFAKYVTADSKNDKAQVAKWGVTVEAQLDDLFVDEYKLDDTTIDDYANKVAVYAAAETNILAPGTSGAQENALVVTGTPEVAVSVDYTVVIELANWEVDYKGGTTFMPLVITLTIDNASKEYKVGDGGYANVAALKRAIENDVNALDKAYVAPNADLAKTISISWSWAFNGNDANDTALGDYAAKTNDITFSFTIGATVTQVN